MRCLSIYRDDIFRAPHRESSTLLYNLG